MDHQDKNLDTETNVYLVLHSGSGNTQKTKALFHSVPNPKQKITK